MAFKRKAQRKFDKVMREFGKGELKSHGEKVTDQKQAVAIAFSEARKINPRYKAQDGMMLEGPSHDEGGIKGIVAGVQPIEMEGGEAIVNKRSLKIRKHIECRGTPEGVVSAINVLGDGIKLSNQPGVCHLKEEIMANNGGKYVITSTDQPGKLFVGPSEDGKYTQWVEEWIEPTTFPTKEEAQSFLDEIRFEGKVVPYTKYKNMAAKGKKVKYPKIRSIIESNKPKKIQRMRIKDNELVKASHGYRYNYGGKTPEQVWMGWTPEQRSHFLYDHNLKELSSEVWMKDYKELPENARQELKGHIMMGQYKHGGFIQEYSRFTKINEPGNFKIIESMSGNDFSKDKILSHGELLVYGLTEDLSIFLDKYGIHATDFDNYEDIEAFLKSLLPQRIKNKLDF